MIARLAVRPVLSSLIIAACLAMSGCAGLNCASGGDGRQAAGLCGLHTTFLVPPRQTAPFSGR